MLVDANLDLVLEATADLDGGRAFLGFEVVLDPVLCQAAQRLELRLGITGPSTVLVQQP